MILLIILQSLIFFVLGALHFYWAFGGVMGFSSVLPTKETGERILNPTKIDSTIVGLGLTVFGIFYLFKGSLITYPLPNWVFVYGGWIIPSLFLLRAIGDFRYVGFFKKVKTTTFGRLDTLYFSPLCLIIGILGCLIQLY